MAAAYTPAGFCPACGYRLDPGRCPECGRQVDRPLRSHPRRRRLIRRVVLAAVAAAALAGVVAVYQFSFEIGRYVVPRPMLRAVSRGDHAIAKWARRALFFQYCDRAAVEWRRAEEREREIDAELSEPNLPEWAGQYGLRRPSFFSDTRGTVIKLAPRSGFTCRWADPTEGIDHGRVVHADSTRILLDAALKREDYTDDEPWSWEYFRVVYRGQVYLIAARHMLTFCNTINAGQSLDYLGFMPQWNLRAAPPRGMTRLPPPYDTYILKEPIEAVVEAILSTRDHVDAVGNTPRRAVTARLTPGADRGVFKGMELYCGDTWPDRSMRVEVMEVAAQRCIATITPYRRNDDGTWPAVSPGWRFSSRDPFCRVAAPAEAPPDAAPLTPPTSSGPSPE